MKQFVQALTLVLLLGAGNSVFAQLPELSPAATVTAAPTSARFFGGASADNGQTYANSFGYDTPIDIDVEIQVEAAHVNTVGNLYVIIVWEGTFFVRDENGAYVVWDLSLENLAAAFPAKTLQASEAINIVDDVPFGPAGVSDTSLAIYLAYDSMAAAGEVYYSGAPLTVAIEAEQTTAQSLETYTSLISGPIVQSRCLVCHRGGGVAQDSALLYVDANQPNFQQTNYDTVVDYIKNFPGGSSLILSKPQGVGHVGGVQLTPNSTNLENFETFVSQVLAE